MVEQTHAGESHSNAIFITSGNHMVVAHGTAGLGDILHAAFVGAFNVVAKGEESV